MMDTKEFSSHLSSIYSQGLMMLGIGLGHELGLFRLLCETNTPMSAQEIANKLRLKERYTREWLGAMTVGKIIHLDPESGLYLLPEAHKKDIQLRASFASVVFVLSNRRDLVKECFKEDGPYGFEYEDEPKWFDWFDSYRSTMCDYTIDCEIIPRLKEQGIVDKLESGIKVADIGSGTGNYTLALARRFPKSHFIGLEYAQRGLTISQKSLADSELKNIEFIQGNALKMPESWTENFDWVFVYDTLHDLPEPDTALAEIHRIMKSDARLTIVEMGFHSNPADNTSNPVSAMYYMCSMFICLPSSMSTPPHIGYGACWGFETLKEKLKNNKLTILNESAFVSTGAKLFVLCSKE